MKKFIAMLTVAAVVFANIGCSSEPAKPAKDKDAKPGAPADKDKKAP
ncbi:MAG: hypothetical protein U0797_19720 [Gemmataceae bacterium]